MKKIAKFLSAIMAFCMLLGTLSMLSVSVFAEETDVEGGETVVYTVAFEEVDGEKVPVAITDSEGRTTAITWKGGA